MNYWKPVVVVLAFILGLAAVFTDGELQQVVLMAAAVTAALVCFDSALNRRNRSFMPWLLLCGVVLAKVAPSVRHGLAAPDTLLFEQWDHLGTVISAFFLMVAMVAIAVVLNPTSTTERMRIVALSLLAATASGAAGAALSFAYNPGFGSIAVARVYETLGWAFAGGALVAGLIAVARSRRPTAALACVAVFAAVAVVLTAWSSAGRSIDVGWWALSWALLALAALTFSRARLVGSAAPSSRSLQVIAIVGALAAIFGVVATFIFGSTWSPGWIVMLLSALGFGALAATHRSTPEEAHQVATDEAFVGAIEAERSAPLGDLLAFPNNQPHPATVPATPSAPVPAAATTAAIAGAATGYANQANPTVELTPDGLPGPATYDPPAQPHAPAAHAGGGTPEQVMPTAPAMAAAPAMPNAPSLPTPAMPTAAAIPTAAAMPGPAAQQGPLPLPTYGAAPAPRRLTAADLTDSLAPKHYDPPTMLLSNAGLQESVLRAFAQPTRSENEVALLFVALRNAEEIEHAHGRIVVDDIVRQLANRLRDGLTDAVCARFAPAAFAALLVGQTPPNDQVIERSTRTLLHMLNDVHSNGIAVRVDVVGGLAQCYKNETADSLVTRANEGLERAVASPEPTLVAMP